VNTSFASLARNINELLDGIGCNSYLKFGEELPNILSLMREAHQFMWTYMCDEFVVAPIVGEPIQREDVRESIFVRTKAYVFNAGETDQSAGIMMALERIYNDAAIDFVTNFVFTDQYRGSPAVDNRDPR
jgi:hypothetical protein